jgi:hypothetical protein
MPGRPKRFIAIGISIAAMAMSTFNTVQITQLNEEISTLKEKTDLILDVVHLHENISTTSKKNWNKPTNFSQISWTPTFGSPPR